MAVSLLLFLPGESVTCRGRPSRASRQRYSDRIQMEGPGGSRLDRSRSELR
jgi:hypothetical protein